MDVVDAVDLLVVEVDLGLLPLGERLWATRGRLTQDGDHAQEKLLEDAKYNQIYNTIVYET